MSTETSRYEYYINMDERGEFFADVRTEFQDTVFEIRGFDIFEDGFMKHKKDIGGLERYLKSLKILNDQDSLYGSWEEVPSETRD